MVHGTRARYVRGCRCDRCRAANAAYHRGRGRGVAEYVDAAPAREHLEMLRGVGVGLRRVAQVTGLARSFLQDLRGGVIRATRPGVARRILAVSGFDRAGGSKVDASRAREMVEELAAAGIPRARIASAFLGRPARYLAVGERVTARNARAIEELHWRAWRASAAVRAACRHDPPVAAAGEVV